MRFEATRITPSDAGTARIEGELTIRGTTSKLDFPMSVAPLGDDSVVLRGSVQIDRAEFESSVGLS